jgi:hypothetical protein
MSVQNCRSTLHNIPEGRISVLHRGGRLKSSMDLVHYMTEIQNSSNITGGWLLSLFSGNKLGKPIQWDAFNPTNHQCKERCALINHSFCGLPTGALRHPKRVLHTVQYSGDYLNVPHPLLSLRSSSSCIHLLAVLPITSILLHYLSFKNVFQKAGPTQDVTNPVRLPSVYCT